MEEENCFSSLAMNNQNADEPQPQELNETSSALLTPAWTWLKEMRN